MIIDEKEISNNIYIYIYVYIIYIYIYIIYDIYNKRNLYIVPIK